MSDERDSSYFPTSDDPGHTSGWRPTGWETGFDAPALAVGEVIGRYRLVERLGEGGFGVVWRAEQLEPVRRSVALKVIKPGMDSRAVLMRFEAERQALAVMDHPCIARVFDGGVTDRGYPYFVMELVRGESITAFCDRHRLSIRQRVELFIRVCEAVQHAHMKGVIHRDLKPANVLVAFSAEGRPEPKVIDFGIAKALGDRDTDRHQLTRHGQLIGTPAYMSPEQANPGSMDVDTRTDVYALGVMLYELLTGTLPLDRQQMREAGISEVHRLLMEVEPPKPSTRIRALTAGARSPAGQSDALSRISEARQAEPRVLCSILRRDLDWVVMKCMEKERARRYATPAEIAAELRRFLASEPVLAGPPSATYRFGKLVRRHRVAFALGGAMVIVLVSATAVSVRFALQAQRQRDLARIAQQQAETASAAEKERADQLERVARFQSNMISGLQPDVIGRDLLRRVASETAAALNRRGEDDAAARLAELDSLLAGVNGTNIASALLDHFLLERAEHAIQNQFADQPLMRARLLETVGDALTDLGLTDRALAVYRAALAIRQAEQGLDHPEALVTQSNLANLLAELGQTEQAVALQERVAEQLRAGFGERSTMTLSALVNLAAVYRNSGRLEDSLRVYEHAVPLHEQVFGPDAPETMLIRNNLGVLYWKLNRFDDSLGVLRGVLESRTRTLGPGHIDTARSMANLALSLDGAGQIQEAIEHYEQALPVFRAQLGDEHPETLEVLGNLSVSLYTVGRIDEAVERATECLRASRRLLGDEHPDTLVAIGNLGGMLEAQGRAGEALPYYREVLDVRTRRDGPRDPDRLTALSNMSYLLENLGQLDEAISMGLEALRLRREVLGNEHVDTIASMSNVGALLRTMGRLEEAEQLGEEAVATARRVLPEGHWMLGAILVQHGRTLNAMHRFAEALPELELARGILINAFGEDHRRVREVREDIERATRALPD
ncbi:MAG: hypothetical protein Kow0022_05290 [Phycisphaerales bacterium]